MIRIDGWRIYKVWRENTLTDTQTRTQLQHIDIRVIVNFSLIWNLCVCVCVRYFFVRSRPGYIFVFVLVSTCVFVCAYWNEHTHPNAKLVARGFRWICRCVRGVCLHTHTHAHTRTHTRTPKAVGRGREAQAREYKKKHEKPNSKCINDNTNTYTIQLEKCIPLLGYLFFFAHRRCWKEEKNCYPTNTNANDTNATQAKRTSWEGRGGRWGL